MSSKSVAKSLTFFAAISLVFAARADITSGLIGYWSLSDGPGASTVTDLTGNGGTATLTNFTDATYNNMWTTSSDTTDGWPFAMLFNQSGEGANTYINVPDSSILNSPSTNRTWTLSAWVKCSEAGTAEPRYAGIIAKGNQGAEAYGLYMNDTAGSGKFSGIFHNASLGSAEVATSSTVAQSGVWYHVAVTVLEPKSASANAEAILYVNGVAESGANANTYTTVYSTNLPVTIGCRRLSSGAIGAAFAGTIDDVRIYNRALSASDIAQLAGNKAFAPNNSGIGYWNGLGGSGGNATLDTTSLNFCTNVFSAPVGTAASLGNVLTLDNGSALPPSVTFASTYYSNSLPIAVAATNLTIAPGGIAVATANAAGTINFANNLTTTYILNSSDSIGIKDGANPTSLVQSGNGTAILTGANTFSGGVTINWGTVQAGNGGPITGQELGTGSVTDNSTLVFNGNNSAAFNRSISGTGAVIQKGSGTLTLTAANTYTGGTTISSGALSVNSLSDAGSPVSTGSITLSGGTLNYTGTVDSTARQFTGIAGTTNTIDVASGANLEITGRITGSAAWLVNKIDSGTLTISGAADNSFLGLNVNGGTVILNKTSASNVHAIGNPLTVNSGGTVQLSGAGTTQIFNNASAPVTITSGGVFDANGQSETFNKLTLSGNGSGSGALINSAASTTSALTASIVLAGNTTIGGAGNITLPSVVSGTGVLTYAGTGTLTLSAANTYSGTTVVSAGLLDGTVNGAIPGNVTVTGTGTLSLDTAAILSPTAILTLPASPGTGIVNLNFSGTQTISALFIGTTSMPGGTYGAPGSGATHENAAFQNVGILYVAQTFWDANHTDANSQSSANGGGSGNWNNATANWWISGNADTIWSAGNVAYFSGTAGTVTLN
ncbi:MAG: beta strand repeat-containing protein, partial [Limisphaerales bacterium]